MGNIGPEKILIILVVALIVLGPEKLPGLARQVGRAWGDLRRFREGVETDVRGAFGEDGDRDGGEGSIGTQLGSIRDTLHETLSSAAPRAAASEKEMPESAESAGSRPDHPDEPQGPGRGARTVEPRPQAALTPGPADLPVPPGDPSLN